MSDMRLRSLTTRIVILLRDILAIPEDQESGTHTRLADLGLDSLDEIDMANSLESFLNTQFDDMSLFREDGLTVEELAARIEVHLGERTALVKAGRD